MDKVTSIATPKRRNVPRKAHHTKAQQRQSLVEKERWAKAEQAWQLRLGGKLPSEIAEILGISNLNDVTRLLAERFEYDAAYLSDQDRKSMLAMEIARLDALQAAVWPSAMMGDPKSVDSAVRIVQARARIAGLEQIDPVVNKNLVLVMGDREDDYIEALKKASE